MKMNRAYAVIAVKAVDEETRTIEGIATTPTPDRVGDIVEPKGAVFTLPIPLLWQHDSEKPIGHVIEAKVTDDGIRIKARIERMDEPGRLKDRLDEAWQSLKKGLVRGLSIGFKAMESVRLEDTWSYRFTVWEWLELSAVTIPANADCSINAIKSIDRPLLAASGKATDIVVRLDPPAGASAHPPKLPKEGTDMKTIAEQIAALEEARAKKAARMAEVMQKSIEAGRSTDAAEREEFDTLQGEIDALDADLKRLKSLEALQAKGAKPVADVRDTTSGTVARASDIVVKTPEKLEKGIRFARLARCIGLAKGNLMQAREIAENQYKHDEVIANVLKGNIVAGTSVAGNWAANLVGEETSVFADFIEFLRPQTILGKFGSNGIPSLHRVPFRVPLIGQTQGGSGYWVGQGKSKPLTKFDFSRTTLVPMKVANIAVATMELLRDSSPSAEILLRNQLAAALRERMDIDFIDPNKAVDANISPASITNGLTPIPSVGNSADSVREDVRAIMTAFIQANNAPTTGVWIMSATTALGLSLMVNALGQREFPGVNMNGGVFEGLPVITSEYVPVESNGYWVILANANDVYFSDEGEISIDMSTEASLEMVDIGTMDSSVPTPAQLVSLWQTNSVGFRAERTVNWSRRRDEGVALLEGVHWGEPGT